MKNANKTQRLSLSTTGSFFNYLMANNSSIPVVGEGATILLYSDRKVADVIEVSKDGKKVVIEHLNAKNISKQFGEQDWEFSPSGIKQTIVWRNNSWKIEMNIDGIKVYEKINILFGAKNYYYDYSF
jgi:hypothetical protein